MLIETTACQSWCVLKNKTELRHYFGVPITRESQTLTMRCRALFTAVFKTEFTA